MQNLNPPTIVGDEPTIKNKIKSIILKQILNDEKPPTDVGDDGNDDVGDITLARIAEKIEPDIDYGEDLKKLFQANTRFTYEPNFDNIVNVNDWANMIN